MLPDKDNVSFYFLMKMKAHHRFGQNTDQFQGCPPCHRA